MTFTASITSGSGTPSGTVNFKDGAAVIGSAALSGGVATFTTSTLNVGTHAITAVYAGNGGFAASASAVLMESISIPTDSANLRALQIAATRVVAQNSGQAISGAIDAAIADGFSGNPQPIAPPVAACASISSQILPKAAKMPSRGRHAAASTMLCSLQRTPAREAPP